MIKSSHFLLFTLFFTGLMQLATAQKPYFQQEVNYRITGTLDDQKHTLRGEIEIQYINNSPNELSQIWIHLWANAFGSRKTAFAKQKLRDGSRGFYFAPTNMLGNYTSLDFQSAGDKIAWQYDPENPDIAVLNLRRPLAPGEGILIKTPYLLKIPGSFSRLGHVEQTYQMTQWYPKAAVYDREGWHAMPNLDIGEFYYDFGNYDVTLDLPEGYVVGATGTRKTSPDDLQNGRERWHFTASQVSDFAWFADKAFVVQRDTARLASGRTVLCYGMYPAKEAKLWEKSASYVRRAVEFYSKHVGEYPWPQATAVSSALSAGGGMEYPMVTVIGPVESARSLDEVITHEVGHNWFYGILASNERDHPFLDEGFNSYYEGRYMRQYYANNEPVKLPKWFYDYHTQGSLYEGALLMLMRQHNDTPPDTHSNDMAPMAYGIQAYAKTAYTLYWLEQAVGTEAFDKAMKHYFDQWKFKHPYPADVKASWAEAGLKDTDWWFEQMQTKHYADYGIRKINKKQSGSNHPDWEITLKNKGKNDAPVPVSAIRHGEVVSTIWAKPGESVRFNNTDADAFEIDAQHATLDYNRNNNYRRTSGLFPGLRSPQFGGPVLSDNDARHAKINVLPWLGWNNADKTQVGLIFSNPVFPISHFNWTIAPGFAPAVRETQPATSTSTAKPDLGGLTGFADFRYHFFTRSIFPKITISLGGKTFHTDYNWRNDYYTRTARVVPQIRLELADKSISFQHYLNFRTLLLRRETPVFNDGTYSGKTWERNTIYELSYEMRQKRSPNPWTACFMLESQDYTDAFDRPANYLKGSMEWRQQMYYQKNRKISARLFAGYFIQNSQRDRDPNVFAWSANPQGFNDYKFDYTFTARDGGADILGRQVTQGNGGGFKGAFGPAFIRSGTSNNYLISLNLKADLPQRLPLGLPLKPYFDFALFDDAAPTGEGLTRWWSFGLAAEFFKGGFEVYFPLANSKALKNLYCEQGGGSNASAL
ncbi:MAG: M1 family metallopeptidase, partial [Saprospiraceae bacterium]|nr:M1 family metallopeptidase [Saprospiraceae bacterium]